MRITEEALALFEQNYSAERHRIDASRIFPDDADTLLNLLDAGLIEPATSWGLDGYVLTELGRFIMRRRCRTARPPDPFILARRELPTINLDHLG